MAAYASLLSLSRSLHQILNLEQCIDPLHQEIIVSLHEKVDSIVTFLEDYSEISRGTEYDRVENGIREAAYEAQDFIDSYLCLASRTSHDWSSCDKVSMDLPLNMAFERINFIWDFAKMKNIDTKEDHRSRTYSSPTDNSSVAKSVVVGFDDDLNAIKELLYQYSAHLQVIPIVGMGGIGKTTLARRAYEDSLLARNFDVCIWITVSPEYRRRDILLNLLQYFNKPTVGHNQQPYESEAELAKQVYQNLMGRRYFIVMDDIWNTDAWDDLKMIFPDDGSGSRILFTTRISDVAVYAGSTGTSPHQMNFLNEDQSWKLLEKRLFGQESCPLELVEIGKKIARTCGGLPLTIVVVAGLLLSSNNVMRKELWENILENISSTTKPTIALRCSKILCLSYDRLPLRLKPCFLYMAAFPEDYGIDVSKLIKLWAAEGFLKPSDKSKCLEDVGEWYLNDLVNRSLILVSKKGSDGKLETIGIHDLLREICITKAQEEEFFHHVTSERNVEKYTNRRVSFRCNKAFHEWRIQDSSLRSVLLFSEKYMGSRLSVSCGLLSILDAPEVTWPNLSDVIAAFVNLRYIAFGLNDKSCPNGFPASISKLLNLQTIIAHITDFPRDNLLHVPCEIWKMPNLRHLIMDMPFSLSSDPNDIGIFCESDLQTLDSVIDFIFTEEAIKLLANLKKLKVKFDIDHDNWDDFNLNNIFHLQNLEDLQVSMACWSCGSWTWNHNFPISLKKLTLYGIPLPWENMSIIGSLPNLQVLVMMNIEVDEFSEWTPMEGEFIRLKYFRSSLDYLIKWEAEKEHFPSLETLVLRRPMWINEIPCGVGEIDSLQLIELQYCTESLVNSAKQIQKQQHENGNYAFQVWINDHDEYNLLC